MRQEMKQELMIWIIAQTTAFFLVYTALYCLLKNMLTYCDVCYSNILLETK